MITRTVLYERKFELGALEPAQDFRRRMTLDVEQFELAFWSVRQIVQIQDHHAFFVVFERESE